MQVVEQSSERLVLQSRKWTFRALGLVLVLVPLMALLTIARSAFEWYSNPGSIPMGGIPKGTLIFFASLLPLGCIVLLYGPYRITHIFDRKSKSYVMESTSARRTWRLEYSLDKFSGVEVQEGDEGDFHVSLIDDGGNRLPLGNENHRGRARMDAVADLVESFISRV